MATKPDKLPEYATTDLTDPDSGQNNVVEPSQTNKDFGHHPVGKKPNRGEMNWLHRKTYENLKYHDSILFPYGGNGAIDMTGRVVFGFDNISGMGKPILGWTFIAGVLNIYIHGLVAERSVSPLAFFNLTGTPLATLLDTIKTRYFFSHKPIVTCYGNFNWRETSSSDMSSTPFLSQVQLDMGNGAYDLTYPYAIRFTDLDTSGVPLTQCWFDFSASIPIGGGDYDEISTIYFA